MRWTLPSSGTARLWCAASRSIAQEGGRESGRRTNRSRALIADSREQAQGELKVRADERELAASDPIGRSNGFQHPNECRRATRKAQHATRAS
jgi:hypothetical protein